MQKSFNIEGLCIPEQHYMVDISSKLDGICCLIEQGKYFTMNRARQYGKTTTMELLRRRLSEKYVMLSLSFEEFGKETFTNEDQFVRDFLEIQLFPELDLQKENFNTFTKQYEQILTDKKDKMNLAKLSKIFAELCRTVNKPIIMMIDEVDSACNNQVFIDFLAILRAGYMKRSRVKTFQSVILAGVYDVKNLKVKLEPDHEKHNSPWNIAADFDIDLGFSIEDIQTMLQDYMIEQHIEMNVIRMAELIFAYTDGYPYLVSYICKKMDKNQLAWNEENIQKIVYQMPKETNPLFDDIIKKLEQHESFRKMVERILLNGEDITFVRSNPDIDLGMVFGIFKNKEQKVCISNEIFELFIYEYMISVRRNRDYRLSKSRDASMPLAQTKFYTEDDYYTLPENVRAELIDGYLVYNQAAPSRIHQTILMELSGTIREYIKSKKGSCRVYPAPFAVKLMEDRETIVEPDISIICDRNKLTDRGCSGAPDWIIEIVSPSNSSYDYITKLNLYADAGVREYWIVAPSKETVFVYYLEKTDFKVETYTFQDNIKVNIYEDFSIDFTELDL